jgi:hypothetical protein
MLEAATLSPRRKPMTRQLLAAIAYAAVLITPVLAAEPQAWPWKSPTPPDPALAMLPTISEVTASVDKAIVSITVKAMAPTPGYGELQLTPRMGDPNDRIFAFDGRGRAPQDVTDQVETPVTIEASYADAPIGKFDVIEVYGKDNCMAFSLTDAKPVDCSSKSLPQ